MDKPLKIYSLLEKEYPHAKTALTFSDPWQLLVATILSAQCTDERVNRITGIMFKEHPGVKDYVNMDPEHLIEHIKSAGFYRNKARSILNAAKEIKEKFNGKVPRKMEEMLTLPGVARKTANVVLSNAYNIVEGIAVDTHVKRVSYRLGLTKQTNPDKIEKDLMEQVDKDKWFRFNYFLIEHGRAVCKAPTPVCSKCVLNKLCPKNGVKKAT